MKVKHIFIIAVILLAFLLLIAKCNHESKKEIISTQFINPPNKEVNVPFKNYIVDADKGGTVIYPTGSVLIFPANAFVDQDGKVINGNVEVKYREFKNPVDFFISGIPMTYDSGGVNYTFESAGMCEIGATKNGKRVFVNPEHKTEINMASKNNDVAQNLYFLDTISKKWVHKGKSEIISLVNENKETKSTDLELTEIPVPIKPRLLDDELPIIKVIIDSGSFEELMVYNNLRFQLDKEEKSFDPQDSQPIWDDFKLIKNKKLNYQIQFTRKNQIVKYKVHPVLEEKDYANALKVYDKQISAYEKKIKERMEIYKINREQHIRDSINDLEIDRENNQTARLNKIIEEKNKEIEARNQAIEAENSIIESKNQETRLVRSFKLEQFGIWNCDYPRNEVNTVTVNTTFSDQEGNKIIPEYSFLFQKNFNGLFQLRTDWVSFDNNKENMIVTITGGRFAYITYEEFRKLNITDNTKTVNLPLHVVSSANNNYAFINSIVAR